MSGQRTNRGRRYEEEPKLNYTKVFAVLIAIVVIITFILAIKNILSNDVADNKVTGYFALYTENKWGVIDSKGDAIIPAQYAEMIIVPDSTQDIFLCTYDINSETGEYKTKALNKKNEEIFTEYEQIEAVENFDKNENVWYEKDVLKVKKNGKYGLITFKGKEIVECQYDEIYALKGIENSFVIKKDDKVGLIDKTGRIIINTEYKEITNLGKDYNEGFITIAEDGKYGVISYSGEVKLKNEYDKIEQIYGKDTYVVKNGNKTQVINASEEVLISSGFDEIKEILQKSSGVIFEKNKLYGVMSTSGEVIIDAKYENIYELQDGNLVAMKDTKYGIIDLNENIKLNFDYTSIAYNKDANIYIAEDSDYKSSIINSNFEVKLIGILSELNQEKGYIRMRIDEEYKYYNLKFEEISSEKVLTANTLFLSKKNDKYGYVDEKGDVVVDYIYDDATEQNIYGYVAVKKNGVWGSLDSKGNKIIEPKYSLENNLIIDFIGKWHLGEELNMNYYCDQ
ncbi:MAG: WG repeat-containing protein [Clostridia bacterium]|nr:WG repeat-containing protein [Clostridia bacterium]